VLTSGGYEVTVCASAAEALALLQRGIIFDAIVKPRTNNRVAVICRSSHWRLTRAHLCLPPHAAFVQSQASSIVTRSSNHFAPA